MAGDGPHHEVGSSRALFSPTVMAMEAQAVQDRTERLVKLLEGRKRLLVWTHTHPDPDALGAAMGLRHLAKEKMGIDSAFCLVGRVMRAENKAMVRCLGIDLTPCRSKPRRASTASRWSTRSRGSVTPSCPRVGIDIVLDHHVRPRSGPRTRRCPSDVRTDDRRDQQHRRRLPACRLEIPPERVATALYYGIRTDTADLSRNASPLDVRGLRVPGCRGSTGQAWPRSRPRTCRLPYYKALRDALNNIRIYDAWCCARSGKISSPEMVAEVADLLVRLEGKQAVFCGGMATASTTSRCAASSGRRRLDLSGRCARRRGHLRWARIHRRRFGAGARRQPADGQAPRAPARAQRAALHGRRGTTVSGLAES